MRYYLVLYFCIICSGYLNASTVPTLNVLFIGNSLIFAICKKESNFKTQGQNCCNILVFAESYADEAAGPSARRNVIKVAPTLVLEGIIMQFFDDNSHFSTLIAE